MPQGRGRHEHFRGSYYKSDEHRVGANAVARGAAGGLGGVEAGGDMNVILLKAILALVPTCLLFSGSAVLISRERTVWSSLQLIGAGCLVIVALTHVSEALDLFSWMHWGREDSLGHYLDLLGVVLGLTLFPTGYLLHALATRRA